MSFGIEWKRVNEISAKQIANGFVVYIYDYQHDMNNARWMCAFNDWDEVLNLLAEAWRYEGIK